MARRHYHARSAASPRKASCRVNSLGEWPRTCTASGRGGLRDGVDHQDQPAGDPEAVASRIGRSSERNVRETRLKRRDRVVRVLTPPLPGPTFRAAVRDVLDDYRMNRKRSPLDVEPYVRLHLGPSFGRHRLAAITTADIRRYVLRRQEEGARNATINRELSVLKRAFTLAIAAGTLASRPHIALLREDNVRRGFFEAEDFESVRRRLSPDLADFVSFLYTTGWRWRCEAARLRWTNIAFDAGEVRLEPGTTKTGEGRVFPFTADLRALLERRRAVTRDRERELGRLVPHVFTRADQRTGHGGIPSPHAHRRGTEGRHAVISGSMSHARVGRRWMLRPRSNGACATGPTCL